MSNDCPHLLKVSDPDVWVENWKSDAKYWKIGMLPFSWFSSFVFGGFGTILNDSIIIQDSRNQVQLLHEECRDLGVVITGEGRDICIRTPWHLFVSFPSIYFVYLRMFICMHACGSTSYNLHNVYTYFNMFVRLQIHNLLKLRTAAIILLWVLHDVTLWSDSGATHSHLLACRARLIKGY